MHKEVFIKFQILIIKNFKY